jgi:Icc-related predicted phosphoesterase
MKTTLEDIGAYSFDTTADEVRDLQEHPEKVDAFMETAIEERTKRLCDLILERIDTKKVKAFVMPGNDDIKAVDEVIKSYEDKGIIYPLDKVTDVGGFETISFEYVNPTPWDTPREMTEPELKKGIESLVKRLSDPSKSIFCFHCPPINTKLDSAPKLDKKLAIQTEGGVPQFEHVGSKSVKEALEKYQPMLGLHGHIHEAFGFDQVGKTLILNPGSEYGEGILRGYIIELSPKGVEKYWKVEG